MSIKYISQDKDEKWKISITKSGKASNKLKTKNEAIQIAILQKNTEAIFIKENNIWYNLNSKNNSKNKLNQPTLILEKNSNKTKISKSIKKEKSIKNVIPKTKNSSLSKNSMPIIKKPNFYYGYLVSFIIILLICGGTLLFGILL